MRKRRLFILIGCILLLIGIIAVVIVNKRNLAGKFVAKTLIKTFEFGMKPANGEVESYYDPQPVPQNITEDGLQTALDILSKSFFLVFRHNNLVGIEGDVFLLPNSEFVKIDVSWETITTEEGKNILKKVTEAEKSEFAQFVGVDSQGLYRDKLMLITDDKNVKPYIAKGKAVVTLPIQFAKFEFKSNDVGKSIIDNGIICVLERCKNNFLHIEIDNLKERQEILIVTYDHTGERLALSERTVTSKDIDFPDSTGKIAANIKCLYLAQGRISAIEIYVPVQTVSRELVVTAASKPNVHDVPNRSTSIVPRYVKNERDPQYQTLTTEQVRAQTKVVPGRNYAMMGYNTPEIRIMLPRVNNSVLAKVEFTRPKLLDRKGNKIEFELVRGGYDYDNFSNNIRFLTKNRKDVIVFKKAIGIVKVKYPMSVSTLTFTREKAENRGFKVEIDGPKIYCSGTAEILTAYPFFINENYAPVRAYDITGRQLEQLWRFDRTGQGAFWGTVNELQMDVVNKWFEFEVPYNLQPIPMLPLNKIGKRQ